MCPNHRSLQLLLNMNSETLNMNSETLSNLEGAPGYYYLISYGVGDEIITWLAFQHVHLDYLLPVRKVDAQEYPGLISYWAGSTVPNSGLVQYWSESVGLSEVSPLEENNTQVVCV